jgi:very-short-patch-repair endonuclease
MSGRNRDRIICPTCAKEKARKKNSISSFKGINYYQKKLDNRYGNEFRIIGNRKRENHRYWEFLILHNCGAKRWIEFSYIYYDGYCPNCDNHRRHSSGERATKDILTSMNIDFIEQYKPKTCRYKGQLSFDFLVKTDCKCLIEIDGDQHRKAVSWGSSEPKKETSQRFQNIVLRDKIKDEWCNRNKFWLLRIKVSQIRTDDEINLLQKKIQRGLSLIRQCYSYDWLPHVIKL